jgi:hypothetical protein
MRWTRPSGVATVALASALLAIPGELIVLPASVASVSGSTAFAPTDDPVPDCATDPGNPACAPAPPPDQTPPHHRHGSGVVVGPPLAPFNMPPMAH